MTLCTTTSSEVSPWLSVQVPIDSVISAVIVKQFHDCEPGRHRSDHNLTLPLRGDNTYTLRATHSSTHKQGRKVHKRARLVGSPCGSVPRMLHGGARGVHESTLSPRRLLLEHQSVPDCGRRHAWRDAQHVHAPARHGSAQQRRAFRD
eukprot:6653250-Prymnesium_polylepis.1